MISNINNFGFFFMECINICIYLCYELLLRLCLIWKVVCKLFLKNFNVCIKVFINWFYI